MVLSFNQAETGRLSINTATVRKQCDLIEIIDFCAEFNISGISPWRDQVQNISLKKASSKIRSNKLTVTGYCRGGMFPQTNRESFEKNIADNFLAIEEAAEIGAKCLVLVVGGLPEDSKDIVDARKQVLQGIEKILPFAEEMGVPLAIEPLHPMYAADRSCVNTLMQSYEIAMHFGEYVGIAFDVYHCWWEPTLINNIEITAEKIFAYHVCDWLKTTKDLLLDRGMIGEGVIDLPLITDKIFSTGYKGYCEIEIFSAQKWWNRPAREVFEQCVQSHKEMIKNTPFFN